MRIRAIATAAATFGVALVVALAVPVSQLRTVSYLTTWCCCPDPSKCHCPTPKPDRSGQPVMRTCHKTANMIVAPQAPSFSAPEIANAAPPVHRAVPPAVVLASPHAPPVPARPDAPS